MTQAPVYDDRELDRTPPQDLNAEQSVLGAMLMSKDAISDVVEVLRGVDFYRPNHEAIFDAILNLYGRGEPADPITVAGELGKSGQLAKVGGPVYLHDLLASVSIAANAPYYAEIVRDKAVLRRLVNASIRIAQLGYQGQGEVDKIVDEAQQTLFEVTEKAAEDYKSLRELIEPTFDEIEAIQSSGDALSGVPTGFTELDRLTNGLHAGQMIIIAARPAMGKSTLALDFARAAAAVPGMSARASRLSATSFESAVAEDSDVNSEYGMLSRVVYPSTIQTIFLFTIAGYTVESVVSHGATASTRWAGSRLNRILLFWPITLENRKFRSAYLAANTLRVNQLPIGTPPLPVYV